MPLPTNATRDAARAAFERQPAVVLELDLDRCMRTFGVLPCTATGTPCYNTRRTCKDPSNYFKGTQTLKFCSRGMPIPAGETIRPYILSADAAVTEIDPDKGVARRGTLTLTLIDEPDADVETDPYVATRSPAAAGTFWARLLARNPHYPGRFARVRRGYVQAPWTWLTFLDELYVIDSIAGPDRKGQVRVILKDPLKLADRNKLPVPTDGKLLVDLKARENTGTLRAATVTTAQLAVEASATDGAYVGMEIVITGSDGAGQRRVISGYAGDTRTATVADWTVMPANTSTYEVSALSLSVPTGKGAQYANPGTSGKREFVRVGSEVIEYHARSGDVLSWTSSTARGRFGSTRSDHRAGDGVQLCRAFIDQAASDVVRDLLAEAGVPLANIDTAALAAAEARWWGGAYRVTTCIAEPRSNSELLDELLPLLSAVLYWSPPTQKGVVAVVLPTRATPPAFTDAAHLVEGSVEVETLDALRLSTVALYYAPVDVTDRGDQARDYGRAEIAIDTDAESAAEYGDRRVDVAMTRWFGASNEIAAMAYVRRRLNALRDAPKRVRWQLDPKDYTQGAGEFADLSTRRLPDVTGAAVATRVLITKVEDQGGRIRCEGRTTGFARRYGFIAPNGTADHPTDTVYAHVSNNSGLMGDGSSAYLII